MLKNLLTFICLVNLIGLGCAQESATEKSVNNAILTTSNWKPMQTWPPTVQYNHACYQWEYLGDVASLKNYEIYVQTPDGSVFANNTSNAVVCDPPSGSYSIGVLKITDNSKTILFTQSF